jgi:hypothetical protein
MIFIFVGLVWLKFIDSFLPCVWGGVVFAGLCGGAYLFVGVQKMRREKEAEDN